MHPRTQPSNLLIGTSGVLKICDFGLARSWVEGKNYTNPVITLNYRPPELLLGEKTYGMAIDVWSAGCIFGELLTRKMMFNGTDENSQLEKLYQLCGSVTEDVWPGCSALSDKCDLPSSKGPKADRILRRKYEAYGESAVSLLDSMLILDPAKRVDTGVCLDHDYFWEGVRPSNDEEPLPWNLVLVRNNRTEQLKKQEQK